MSIEDVLKKSSNLRSSYRILHFDHAPNHVLRIRNIQFYLCILVHKTVKMCYADSVDRRNKLSTPCGMIISGHNTACQTYNLSQNSKQKNLISKLKVEQLEKILMRSKAMKTVVLI